MTTPDPRTPDPRTVGGVLRARCAEDPGATFLVCDADRLTYGELRERSTEVAAVLLAAGVTRGSHVGLLLGNDVDFAVTAVAVMRIGAVVVPLSTLSTVAELATLVDSSAIRLLVAAPRVRARDFRALLAEALGPLPSVVAPNLQAVMFTEDISAGSMTGVDARLAAAEAAVRPSDPVVIVHTSGSTSAPKGVVHAHGALLDHLAVLNDLRAYGPGEVLFSNSPFFWIGGFAYTFLGTLVAGATVLSSVQADPAKVLDMMERERPTMCNGYAASATALAADPSFAGRDLSSMTRGNLYAIMPADLVPADPALRTNMLGMTEGGSVILTGTAAEAERDLPVHLRGSFGRPTPDVEARIVDLETGTDCADGEQGELWIRGAALMLGYFGRERAEVFDADGWFRTGDLVYRVLDPTYGEHWFFGGRGDDMIKTAGANVSPAEVVAAIRATTGRESVVLGLPDPEKGQVVAAVLLDASTGEAAGLREALAPVLSSYKVPRVVRVLPATSVPLKAGGKVDLAALRDVLGALPADART